MRLLKDLFALILFFTLSNSSNAQNQSHPSWIMQGNIYEVNVRQYTSEGTFKAFEKHLQRLKNMGVQTLWFMPINPISKKERKGSLGSYYAISDYEAINPEFGNMEDWKHLVNKAHAMGFKIIIDWVANHTGADHYWLNTKPDFFVRDSAGKFVSPYDWTDVYKLDYSNAEMVDSMIAQMKFWLVNTNIDGFRCDVADGPSNAFWKKCITELKKTKNVFMLAESEDPQQNRNGFDATYTWSVLKVMAAIVKGDKNVSSLDSAVNRYDTAFPPGSLHMYFTSNHDENSWNKADYGTTPGKTHAPFAILTQTMKWNVPLIYSGQEEPFLRAIRFFDKDTITFSKFKRADFYKKLLLLRKYNPALASNASFKRIKTNNDKDIYSYIRYSGKHFVFVLLNLSDKKQTVNLKALPASLQSFDIKNGFSVMDGNSNKVTEFTLEPWGYKVIMDNDPGIAKECCNITGLNGPAIK